MGYFLRDKSELRQLRSNMISFAVKLVKLTQTTTKEQDDAPRALPSIFSTNFMKAPKSDYFRDFACTSDSSNSI